MKRDDAVLQESSWIWLVRQHPHQYACFRKKFTLKRPGSKAVCHISVDSDFILYLNGREVGRGQFSDYPERKTVTRFEVASFLRKGSNTLAVLAYYRGEDFSDYRAGRAGLIAALECGTRRIFSDDSWRGREHPAFKGGPVPRVTHQMGFVTEFDARRDDAWIIPGYRDSAWPKAAVRAVGTTGYWRELLPRPVPVLPPGPPLLPVSVVVCGQFKRIREAETVARTMSQDALQSQVPDDVFERTGPASGNPSWAYMGPPEDPGSCMREKGSDGLVIRPSDRGMTGRFLIVDLGRECTGLLTFSLDASAGTVLDIGHGEHLEDGRVRTHIGGRNFADRYHCRKGENTFTLPFRRFGARYLQMQISGCRTPVRLRYLTLRPVEWDIEPVAAVRTGDSMVDRQYDIGIHTLRLCMHEHYEDCPWREQSLYAYDSRNQALYGYYAFGNYDFARASIELLGRGLRADGLLELCAPALTRVCIPIFALVWFSEVAEHWLHSGQRALFDLFRQDMHRMMEGYLSRYDARTGLYFRPEAPDLWHFYEWTPGLTGKFGNDRLNGVHHAAYNLHLHEAIGSYAWLLEQAGEPADARQLRRVRAGLGSAIIRTFADDSRGVLTQERTRAGRCSGHFEYIQAVALAEGLIPARSRGTLVAALRARTMPTLTLSSMLYLLKGLMQAGPEARRYARERLQAAWEPMVLAGSTTFWETGASVRDFHYAGSLCHGWSALPVYYAHAHVLGIQPADCGFRRFTVSPCADRFLKVEGAVPTPQGPIHVKWERGDAGLRMVLRGPRACTPTPAPHPEFPIASLTYNRHIV
ncbi:MAG: hypothetical protein A2340_05760 [Lentisphaerae bacterium RIFOXYB12_FULL_60_10]|nr:MAG: hypothetical protein A2340_05760 [Lentisphaerae bacterium RIFOXYB12_FULL_60_10]